MSGYSDYYKDTQQAQFVAYWTEGVTLPKPTEGSLRFNIAHRRAAEAELKELKAALKVLTKAIK